MYKLIARPQLERITKRFERLYGKEEAARLTERFYIMVGRYEIGLKKLTEDPIGDPKKVVLITYPDMVTEEGENPLAALHKFCKKHLKYVVDTIHILPFYPWTSDDGFSVQDYRKVSSDYGEWADTQEMAKDFKLMFDLVLNHCSRKSDWFHDFITGIQPARHYFIEESPDTDLSSVVRPRTSPLLTPVETRDGEAHVWTTFSADQVDLNWKNPDVLFEFLDIFFYYLAQRASMIRLDAVGFIWKELGTSCMHLPQVHEIVKLFRDILEIVAPRAIIITETNVPQKENFSYFGKGDESNMVYNFSLPPLLLHALLSGNSEYLTAWASDLPKLPKNCALFNFTASHDGIGVRALQDLLPKEEIEFLTEEVRTRGGLVSYKNNSDGSQSPYELNITYPSALSEPSNPDLGVQRFLCSQSIALAMKGVPGIYFNSLIGAENALSEVEERGFPRAINRKKWSEALLSSRINDTEGMHSKVFKKYTQMIRRRTKHAAFSAEASQQIININSNLFAFLRTPVDKTERILCLFNLTAFKQEVLKPEDHMLEGKKLVWHDIITARDVSPKGDKIHLKPYQSLWLIAKEK